MHIPKYWFRATTVNPTTPHKIVRWGWSDRSQEEAEDHAQERLNQAMSTTSISEALPLDDYTTPIREEILQDFGTSVITQTQLGYFCLNTPYIAIADVDFNIPPSKRYILTATSILLMSAFILLLLAPLWPIWISLFGLLALVALFPFLPQWLWNFTIKQEGGIEAYCLRRLDDFLLNHPHWIVDVYRTKQGFRYLALHELKTSDDPEVLNWFAWIKADPRYVTLCQRQKNFRARLTPKPARIGMDTIPHRDWPMLNEHEIQVSL